MTRIKHIASVVILTVRNIIDFLLSPSIAAIMLALVGYLLVRWGFTARFPDENQQTIENLLYELYANGGAEFWSIAITVLIIERLGQRRATKERKEELVLQMGSPDNGFAQEAVRLLTHKRWLEDGSLKGANLIGANLQGANLWRANLQGANLWRANLQSADLKRANLQGTILWNANLEGAKLEDANLEGAKLWGANLESADLGKANLQGKSLYITNLAGANLREANLQDASLFDSNLAGANLRGANLQDASLWRADLKGADLREANLAGADLREANLKGAKLDKAIFNEKTILPDESKWTPEKMDYLITLTQQKPKVE